MTTLQGVATTITVLRVVEATMIFQVVTAERTFLPRVVMTTIILEGTVVLLPTEEVGADLEAAVAAVTSAPTFLAMEMMAQILTDHQAEEVSGAVMISRPTGVGEGSEGAGEDSTEMMILIQERKMLL